MYRKIILYLLLICLLCGNVYPIFSETKYEIKDRPQFVRVIVESIFTEWSGSGVFVDDNLILTAGHVVRNAKKIIILYPNKKEIIAKDWYEQKPYIADLGIIKVETPEIESAAIFDEAILEEYVIVCGAPLGIFPVSTKGIVSGIDIKLDTSMFGENKVIIIDAAVNGGNSGSPVFDEDNNIIGIVVGGYWGAQGMNIVVPANECQKFLEKYNLGI